MITKLKSEEYMIDSRRGDSNTKKRKDFGTLNSLASAKNTSRKNRLSNINN